MKDLNDFVLYFEKLPSEGKAWTRDTLVRISTVTRSLSDLRIVRASKSELDRDVSSLRVFKRLHYLEGQLDKPFLYDSELLNRIEKLETALAKRSKRKGDVNG